MCWRPALSAEVWGRAPLGAVGPGMGLGQLSRIGPLSAGGSIEEERTHTLNPEAGTLLETRKFPFQHPPRCCLLTAHVPQALEGHRRCPFLVPLREEHNSVSTAAGLWASPLLWLSEATPVAGCVVFPSTTNSQGPGGSKRGPRFSEPLPSQETSGGLWQLSVGF